MLIDFQQIYFGLRLIKKGKYKELLVFLGHHVFNKIINIVLTPLKKRNLFSHRRRS